MRIPCDPGSLHSENLKLTLPLILLFRVHLSILILGMDFVANENRKLDFAFVTRKCFPRRAGFGCFDKLETF